ncbi:MAG TPA: hypothetical protein VF283_17460 [Bryobacteraceae bacterium]
MAVSLAGIGLGQTSSQAAQKKTPQHGPITPAQPRNPNIKVTDMNMTMPLVAPFFIENGGYQSTITMVNELTQTVHGTIIARASNGTVLAHKVITFAPKSQTDLKVSDLLGGQAVRRITGSLELDPNPQEVTSMAIAAQLSIVDNRTSPATYFEEEFLMLDPEMVPQYRAVVPPTDASSRVALFSASDSPQRVDVECFGEQRLSMFHKSVELGPHQMRLVSACEMHPADHAPFEAAFRRVHRTPGALAISVQTNAPGSLGVWGVSSIGSQHRTEIALNFEDAASLKTQETIFAGVPVGTADLLPGDSFVPDLAVANYGNIPAKVSVLYSTMTADTPDTQTVASFSLPANSIKHVSLSSLNGDPGLRNTFVIKSDTPPGTVIANLVLKGQTEYPAVQLMAKDPAVNNGGEHPWTIADGDRSTVLLFNCSDKEQLFNVDIDADGKVWHQDYKLKPAETEAIEIGALIKNRVKDLKGNTLAADTTSGAISWFTADPGKGTGRLLVSNPETGLARNFSCGSNIVLCGSLMYPNTVASFGWQLVGELGDVSAVTCTAYNPQACSGQSYGGGNGYSYNWWSNNTSIAPITGPNNGSSSSFYGQAVGTGTATGQIYNQYCQSDSQGTNNVTPNVTIQIQNGYIEAGSGVVLLAGPGGVNSTAITAVGTPGGGTINWTAGPNLTVSGINSPNASVSGSAPSSARGDTYVSVTYTINGQTASASARFTVLNPAQLYAGSFPGGSGVTTPWSSGNNSGYVTTITYYLFDQWSTAIQVPGMPLTEVLHTTSNPYGGSFTPPDNTPNTAQSNSAGQMPDYLYAYASGGLPSGFSAARSQSLTGNGFSFNPQQQQTYTQTYADIASQYLTR